MATLLERNATTAPALAETVTLSIDHQVGAFGVSFGGESASGKNSDGWLTIARYEHKDGGDFIAPCEIDHGVAAFGITTTEQLRELATALTRAADRYDALQAAIRGGATPIETRRRRA